MKGGLRVRKKEIEENRVIRSRRRKRERKGDRGI